MLFDSAGGVHARFEQIVRPERYPHLSWAHRLSFPRITQDMLYGKPNITRALDMLVEWMRSRIDLNNVTICTWSKNDLGRVLPDEARMKNFDYQRVLKKFIDVQQVYGVSVIGHCYHK